MGSENYFRPIHVPEMGDGGIQGTENRERCREPPGTFGPFSQVLEGLFVEDFSGLADLHGPTGLQIFRCVRSGKKRQFILFMGRKSHGHNIALGHARGSYVCQLPARWSMDGSQTPGSIDMPARRYIGTLVRRRANLAISRWADGSLEDSVMSDGRRKSA